MSKMKFFRAFLLLAFVAVVVCQGQSQEPSGEDPSVKTLKAENAKLKAAIQVHSVGKNGLEIESKLTNADPKDTVRQGYANVYLVRLVKGKSYTIDMKSTELDSYLRLENAAGKQLAEDDDSGGNLNARIRFTAAADATYRIIATTFDLHETGAYTLSVHEGAARNSALASSSPGDKKSAADGEATDGGDPVAPLKKAVSASKFVTLPDGSSMRFDLIKAVKIGDVYTVYRKSRKGPEYDIYEHSCYVIVDTSTGRVRSQLMTEEEAVILARRILNDVDRAERYSPRGED